MHSILLTLYICVCLCLCILDSLRMTLSSRSNSSSIRARSGHMSGIYSPTGIDRTSSLDRYSGRPPLASKVESLSRRPLWSVDEHDDYSDTTKNNDDDEDDGIYDRALIGELTVTRVIKYVTIQLLKVADAIRGMCLSMENMKVSFIWYLCVYFSCDG